MQDAAVMGAAMGLGRDLADDEMLRDANGQSHYWASVPGLVVLTSVMAYHAGGDSSEYSATAESLSPQDTKDLVADLTLAVRQLSRDAFEKFETVEYQAVAIGTTVNVVRANQIVVGRYQGIRDLTQTLGFGGRRARRDGSIIGGTVLLDNEVDRTNPKRRLLRTHELGHALGFNHVNSRLSVMNPRIGQEMTDFDRQIAMLAFQRLGAVDTRQ